jgi:hypothetical protein
MPIFILSCIALSAVIILVIVKRKTLKNWQTALLSVIATLSGIVIALGLAMTLTDDYSHPTAPQTNTVRTMEKTAEQQEIIDLLSTGQTEVYLFDYQTDATYKRLYVWVEAYAYGDLICKPGFSGALISDDPQSFAGRIALTFNQIPDFSWKITIADGGTSSTITSSDPTGLILDSAVGRIHGPMSGSAEIEDGKEIILYSSISTASDGTVRTYSEEELANNSKLLIEYPLAILVKCVFSKTDKI